MDREPLSGAKLFFLTLGCVFGSILVGMDYTIANASLKYIAGGIGASVIDAQWVVATFSMGNAIGLIITGFLSDRLGSVRLVMTSLILYGLFSLLVGYSFNLNMMIVTRFLQGFVGGPLIPIGQALLIMNFPIRFRSLAISIWGAILIVAPLTAPTIGAYFAQDFSWSWAYFLNVPLALLALLFIQLSLFDRETERVERKFDATGLLFLSIGVISLQTILTKGQQWDWSKSNLILFLCAVTLISFALLGISQWNKEEPLVKFSLFRNMNFTIGTLLTVLSYMALFAAFLITPEWLQRDLNYTPLWSAVALLPSAVFPLIAAPFLPYFMRKMRKSVIVAFCFLAFAISFFYVTQFYTEVSLSKVVISRIIFGFGAIYATPLLALTFLDTPKDELPKASGLYFFCRTFSGSIGAAIFATLWERRTIFHHQRLVESISQVPTTPEKMNLLTNKQAIMLATNDVFWVSGWLCVLLIIAVLVMGQVRFMQMKKNQKLSNSLTK